MMTAIFPFFRVIRTGSRLTTSSMAPKRLLATVMVRVFMGLLSTPAKKASASPKLPGFARLDRWRLSSSYVYRVTLFLCYTVFVSSRPQLRNVTVTLEEDVAQWARIEAARRDTSVSRLLGELLKERMTAQDGYDRAMRRALGRKPFLRSTGRYLTREEAHDRSRLR